MPAETEIHMRTIIITTAILALMAINTGCSTARGVISGVREIGNGLLLDAEATVDGISEADARKRANR